MSSEKHTHIKVGCCGFPVARPQYTRVFNVVEVQQTFYELPRASTALKWAEEAGEGFEFTMKAWQLITHDPKSPTYKRLKTPLNPAKIKNYGFFRHTEEVYEAWERTKEIALALKASIVVFQCPPSFVPSEENKHNMKSFFSTVDRGPFTFAWEPRGYWNESEIEKLCRELKLIHVVDPFKAKSRWGDTRYYRLHGIGGYNYRYSKEELCSLLSFAEEGLPVYFMFNNVYMYENAIEFKNLLLQDFPPDMEKR